MFKIAICVGLIAIAGTLIAQDLSEDQAAKCEAEGGCATFTQEAFMLILRDAFLRGKKSCWKDA